MSRAVLLVFLWASGCSSTFHFNTPYGVPAFGAGAVSVWADGQGNIFVVGQDPSGTQGLIARSQDNGGTWGQSLVPQTARFTGVWGSSIADVWVVGDGVILHATDAQHFSTLAGSRGLAWRAVAGGGPSLVWFAEPGGVWSYAPGGSLTRVLSMTGASALWAAAPVQYYVASESGQVFRSDAPAPVQVTTGALYMVGGSGPTDVFAGGAGGQLFHESVSGWLPLPGAEQTLRAVWGAPNGAVYLAGDGGVYFTANGGRSLVHDATPTGSSLSGTARGELWLAGGGTVYYEAR